MAEFTHVGKSVPKIDAKAKALGQAVYADDIRMPGMLYGKIVRCLEHSHAKIKRLDISKAAQAPGVVKILAPADVCRNGYNTGVLDLMVPEPVGKMLGDINDQFIFTDYVKHQGDAVCGIIANSEEEAEEAAKLIKIEYEPLPVYMTAEQAAAKDAVQFTPEKPGNLAFQLPEGMFPNNIYGWGDVEQGFSEADIIVEDTFYSPKQKQCQLEPHAYVALYDAEGRLNCWTSTQMPKCVHRKLATLFEMPMSRVHVTQTVVGGGFGVRLGMISEPQTCAMAFAVPGRAVKVTQLREEDWLASESRHPGYFWMKIGFKKDGTPVACDSKWVAEGGGYYTHASGTQFTLGSWMLGAYKWQNVAYRGECFYTNAVPCGAYRGYGNPQANFVVEQLLDRGIKELGLDPVEWRKQWHKDVGDDGWCAGVPYSSCALDECLDRGAKAIGWTEKKAKYAKQEGPLRRGLGVSIMTHTSGAMPMLLEHTTATVKLNEDATAEVILACSDLGTGAHTSLQQIAAEALGFNLEDIHIKSCDSDAAGYDIGAHASRTCYVGGLAVIQACEQVKEQILERAAKALQADKDDLVIKDKKVFVQGSPDKVITVEQIAFEGVYNWVMPDTGEWIGTPGQIQGYASFFPPHNSPPWACTFAEVEVNTETGEYKVLECIQAYDIGKAINPALVEGQIEGGIQHGLGQVMCEGMQYDDRGICLNNNFTDYKILGASDMPKLGIILVEQGDTHGPYGAKSVGESGIITPIGAVANAIYDALGVQIKEGPITPEKVLQALKN